MKMTKRILSIVLCLAMIVGIIPMSVFAADAETVLDAAIFCSDVHGSTSDLTSVLSGVKTSGVKYSSIGFVGDTCLTVANTTSIAQSALSDTDIAVMFSYASSHDTENSADISTNWDYSGEVEGVSDYYLVYTIRETDMQNASGASTAAPVFTTWYNGLTAAEKALPIFIMSHRPLHDRRDDNAGAATWYTAISAAAETSDIVFFWGHNHTGDNSVDQAAYYVAKDGTETMTIYNGSTVTPNFTYMNAGYINANGQNPARKGIATTVQITASSLIFQDYNSSGEYSGTYAHNVTVEREFAPEEEATPVLPSKLEVTGTTEYDLGATFVTPTVTVRYTDDTTKEVTDYEVSGTYDMNTVGTYTLTYTYTEAVDGQNYQATAEFTFHVVSNMKTVTAFDQFDNISVSATAENLTGITVTNITGDLDLFDEVFTDHLAVTVALTGHTSGNSVQYSIPMVDNMDTTNLELYYLSGEELVPVEYELITDAQGNRYVKFTTTHVGTFVYGSPNVPDGYTLSKVEVSGIPTDLFVGTALDLTEAVITATYTKEGAEDFIRVLTIFDYDENNFSGLDVNVAGKQAVTFTFENVSAEPFNVYVWGKTFVDDATDVTVTVGNSEYGVDNLQVEKLETDLSALLQNVLKNYVAYDISPVYAENYAATTDRKTVTLPVPEGVTNPVVYYVFSDGQRVSYMGGTVSEDGKTISFQTTHFSVYVVGDSMEIEVPKNETATGSNTTGGKETIEVYILTTSISTGNEYLIVDTNSAGAANILARNGSSVSNTTGTVVSDTNGTYIVLADATDELWTYGSTRSGYSTIYTFKNGDYYLYYTSSGSSWNTTYTLSLTTSTPSRSWSYSNNSLTIRDRYLTGGSSWSLSSSADNVYFYVKTTIEVDTTTTVSGTYSIAGEDVTAPAIQNATIDLESILTFTPDSGTATTEDVSATATYEIVTVDANGNPVNGDPLGIISGISGNKVTLSGNTGKALVKVSYTTDFGVVTDYITIETTNPHHYSIQLHLNNNNTLGAEITAPLALKNVKAGDTYSVWAVVKAYASESDTEGTSLGTLGDALSWSVSNEDIATIDPETGIITFTGKDYGTFDVTVSYTGADDVVYEDTITISATASEFVVPGDGTDDFPEYPNEGAIRHDKTSTAVGNFSETGIAKVELSMSGVPFTTGSEIDVVIMLDMTGSMSDTAMEAAEESAIAFAEQIVKNTDGTFNDNRICVMAFNSGSNSPYTYWAMGTITADQWDSFCTAVRGASDNQVSGGTPYDEALEKCQSVLQAAKTDGTGNDRKQFCVFVSDGGPTSYKYITNYDAVKAGTATSYTSSTASASGGANQSDSNFATIATYTHEYYSTLMKDDSVTMYSVLTGLVAANYPNCTTILQNIASDTSKAYVVEDGSDTSALTEAFSNIAQDILSAATDVTVADKIGGNYTMVFDAPNAVVDAADGGQEYYIEVMDYPLVPVYAADGTTISDYIRGTGTSLLKLYFGYNETGYYAATDSNGTAAAAPTFAQVTLGDKGTKFYWTTDASLADANAVSITSGGTTYYFNSYGVSSEDEDFVASKWYNMTAGAYASGTNTTQQLYTLVEITEFADGVTYYTKNSDGTYTRVTGSYSADEKYYTHSTSITCQNMIIATPYFVYNAATKMLIWTLDEISASEITLTYFLYLNNSGGFSGTDQEIDPDTYTTNQFAYVDYTNFKGTECQLEFPVPQLTWNGAQVSYVFYLVNAQGQPVNRQGRVVPFSEAVYVTDVYTYAIVWNDLEQVAGLSADYLANDLVPNVYALYDNDASYSIHVYEDFNKSNLNNHFVIGGNVTDAYNTSNSWTNANTTMVFNTKADGTKYYIPGAYVADNGNNTANQTGLTYWCKDYNVTGTYTKEEHTDELYGTYYTYTVTSATYNGTATRVPASSMTSTTGGTKLADQGGSVEYVYYVDENGDIYTIVQKSDGKEADKGFDFSNTTVAFAVVWKPELVEDTVVVDFGLDVIIDVIANDNMVPGVVGVRPDAPENVIVNTGILENPSEGKIADVILNGKVIGTASLIENDTAHIRFSFNKENGMQFNAPVTFYYEANVHFYQDGELKDTHKYSSVTIIPATTVYYEDSFVDLEVRVKEDGKWVVDEEAGWEIGSATNSAQAQDRPGASKISAVLDADNNYGYDAAYKNMSTYSMGSAAKINVNATKCGVATFTFYGTGFDVISLTSNDTGSITVKVYDESNAVVKQLFVDTYYGMNADGTLTDASVALYQVPIIKVSGLTYGKYKVEINAAYSTYFDNVEGSSDYDFYLDVIRIYDPTGNQNSTANDAYKADGEGWPTYFEVRNQIISKGTFDSLNDDAVSGIVFMDGGIAKPEIQDYISYGPNNETYLAKNQAIAFDLNGTYTVPTGMKLAKIQIAVKTVGGTGAVEVYGIKNGVRTDCLNETISTATDMYYDITALEGMTVVIKSTGDAVVSITNAKVTYEPDTSAAVATSSVEETETPMLFSIRRSTANAALATMNAEEDSETEPTVPEETVPEETVPEETVPEETVPEETVPEETVPEETAPEETVPEETIPEENEPETFEPEKLEIDLNKNKVKEGDKVKVTIKTSGDVAYIIVNGEIVTDYRSNRRTSEKTWTITLKAEEPGELEIEVVAYDADGVASDAVTETVNVEAKKNPAEIVKDILKGVLGWLFG